MSKIVRKIVRVALYIRVSTEEQKKFGFSIEAQKDKLMEHIKKFDNYQLVDLYIDEGVSADKLKKRTELQRLLEDVKQNKIDLILFTKLDRWFRSVSKYYKIQDILDEHGTNWQALEEDYETITANGKFKVNIMLSVAQQERDRTGERIIDVFDYKVKNKQPITGNMPLGYAIETIDGVKRVVFDENTKPMVDDMLKFYMVNQNLNKTVSYVFDKYNYKYDPVCLGRLLANTMLYGEYRGIKDYCPAYLTKKQFDDIQVINKNKIKERKNGRVYLFSKLIECPHCKNRLVGGYVTNKNKSGNVQTNYYRCENAYRVHKKCDFNKIKVEHLIEEQLTQRLESLMKDYVLKYDVEETNKPKVNEAKIKKEMERLNNLYIKGRIDEDVYETKYNELQSKLSYKPISRDLSNVKSLLKENIMDVYNTLTPSEKRSFWHGLIKTIRIDENYTIIDIDFF